MVTKAAVIGTGMMGPGIAATLASGGVPERPSSAVYRGRCRAWSSKRPAERIRFLAKNELIDPAQATRAVDLLACSIAFDEVVAASDLIIESGPEDMAFKQSLFERMDAIAKPQTILASNTSGLSITAIAARCARPERIHDEKARTSGIRRT